MHRDAAGETLRQIRTLYATGATGSLSDGRLVERFVDGDGPDREDAFAALVHRHGPMVLAVCRRMLASPADADDAFQAVFLVLARKAGTLRRVDRLKPWLYGAAVRTAKEARRRSARLRARESGSLDDVPPRPDRDPDLFELRALLDEELSKLPGRYREPLLLCELEGASRHDAALRLGLPEGTLSSRLARGRTLLRDRLTRRGVALGVGPFVTFPDALAPDGPSIAATVRLALDFASPAAILGSAAASLAEGVLPMLASFPIKMIATATLVLIAAAGLSIGLAARQEEQATPPDLATAAVTPAESDPAPVTIRGVVVDESGAAVAGAAVRLGPYTSSELQAVSGPDGRFTLTLPDRRARDWRPLLARTADGRKLGVFQFPIDDFLSPPGVRETARIVVKPGRPIDVRVTDEHQTPIPGAAVEAAGGFVALDRQTTDADGAAHLLVPPDAPLSWITAQKPATGFDFINVFRNEAKMPMERVDLTLDGPHVARVKALDPAGNPVPGVVFSISSLAKDDRQGFADGRQSSVFYESPLHHATTNAEGVATFDWLPQDDDGYTFFPVSGGYAYRRAIAEGDGETYIARLVPNETIRGRVTLPDGSPASNVWVVALGTSRAESGTREARTRADGTYEMEVSPDEVYIVSVEDEKWRARARLDVVVRRGQPVEKVDFHLSQGTVLRGTMTVEPDGRPAVGETVIVGESAIDLPGDLLHRQTQEDVQREKARASREIPIPRSWIPGFRRSRWLHVKTDEHGRYAIRLGPGDYFLSTGSILLSSPRVVVDGEAELVRDLRIRRKPTVENIPLTGKILGPDGRPVVGFDLTITHDEDGQQEYPRDFPGTDAGGRFTTKRKPVSAKLEARSADGSLAGCISLGRDQTQVEMTLSPTARASGVLLDDGGRPSARTEIAYWGRRIVDGEERDGPTPLSRVKTDENARFTFVRLIVGWTYEVAALRGTAQVKLGVVKPTAPGTLDLGTLRVRGAEN